MAPPRDDMSESKALGTSFVATQGAQYEYTVELARFDAAGIDGVSAISIVYSALEPLVRMADLGDVSIGKIVTNQAQSECGLFVDLGPTEGAAVTATAPKYAATEVRLVVGRSSPWLRRVMWTVLAVCCIGGVVVLKQLGLDWDPTLQLAVGLLAGCGVAVALLIAISRSELLAGGRSSEVTAKLDEVVRAWVESDPGNAPDRTKRKKRKRRRKQKAAENESDEA